MRIHSVDQPLFIYNGEVQSVQTEMIDSFAKIDELIEDIEKRFKDQFELVIYSINTVDYHGEVQMAGNTNRPLIFIRYKFIKIVPDGKIEKYIKK